MRRTLLAICCLLTAHGLTAAEYLASPQGTGGGIGSREAPWPSLEACVKSGKIGKLKPGDTLYLADGFHGDVQISGINDDWVTIAALPGADVRLSRLRLDPAAKWHIKNLRISPTFGQAYDGTIVSFGERGGSGENIIEGCEVFAMDDHTKLDAKQWMGLNSGILMGRNATGSTVRNCYVRNVRFGISVTAFDGIAEGNVSENYSADGMRLTRDRTMARHNVIKGAFVTDAQGDSNHDDSIQCFLHNAGTGTLRGLKVIENYLWGQHPGSQPLANGNQGIAFFDGPLVDFLIEGNVVMVAHWHGIALFDAQGCTITRNWVWTEYDIKNQAWIMLGEKLKQARGNTVTDNWATSFKLNQPGTTAANNQTITKKIREEARLALAKKIVAEYGLYHRVAKRHRFTGELVDELPAEKGEDKNEMRPLVLSGHLPDPGKR